MRPTVGRRRIFGGSVIVAGIGTIAGTLALSGAAPHVVYAASNSFLIITVSDPQGGHYPEGSKFTLTATVTNSSSSGIGPAQPGVEVIFDAGAIGFVTNSGSWSCSTTSSSSSSSSSTTSGDFICSDGTLTPGQTSTLPLVFTATGNPGADPDFGFLVTETGDGTSNTNTTSTATFPNGSVDNPNAYTKDVTSTAFNQKVGVDQIITFTRTGEGTTVLVANTMTFTDGGTTIVLTFPAGAIPAGSHVSVWKANSSFWSGTLSSSSKLFVDGYAAGWTASGSASGSPATATSSVTMVVNNSTITSSDSLFRATTPTAVGSQTGVVKNGAWTVSFVVDPGFVLAQAAATTPTTTSPTTSSSTTTTIAPPPTGGGAPRGGGAALPIAAGVLLVVAGTVVVGTGRRRKQAVVAEP